MSDNLEFQWGYDCGMAFVERLKELYKNNLNTSKATQKNIADHIVVEQSLLSKWNWNKNDNNKPHIYPSLEIVLRIRDKFNCSLDYLLGFDAVNIARKEINIFDVVRTLIMYDVQGEGFRTAQNMMSLDPDKTHGVVHLEFINPVIDEILKEYNNMKPAFAYIEDDIKESMIDSLINKYKRLWVNKVLEDVQ